MSSHNFQLTIMLPTLTHFVGLRVSFVMNKKKDIYIIYENYIHARLSDRFTHVTLHESWHYYLTKTNMRDSALSHYSICTPSNLWKHTNIPSLYSHGVGKYILLSNQLLAWLLGTNLSLAVALTIIFDF